MALAKLLEISSNKDMAKVSLSEERIKAVVPILRQYIAYWREYPDMFVEFLCGSNPENFSLFFYQRVFLRAVMRHRYAYATFPRAYEYAPNVIWTNSFNCEETEKVIGSQASKEEGSTTILKQPPRDINRGNKSRAEANAVGENPLNRKGEQVS